MDVFTKRGPMARDELRLNVTHEFAGDCLALACEWFAADGELVRRDVWANVLMPKTAGLGQGGFGGE